MERYLIPGSKGTLGCPGQRYSLSKYMKPELLLTKCSMNWSWMHHTIGNLVRRFDMALHETTERNVNMVRDNFIGQTEPGTHNVQVKVLEEHFK